MSVSQLEESIGRHIRLEKLAMLKNSLGCVQDRLAVGDLEAEVQRQRPTTKANGAKSKHHILLSSL